MEEFFQVKDIWINTKAYVPLFGNIKTSGGGFSYSFSNGVDLLLSEINQAACAFSYIISAGGNRRNDLIQGEILLQGEPVSLKQLHKISCNLGEAFRYVPRLCRWHSVKSVIERGIKRFRVPYSSDEIREMFRIDKERYQRTINHVGFEWQKCAAAIWFVYGKKIFSFPWMTGSVCAPHFVKTICKVLREHHCLVFLPTNRRDVLEHLADHVIDFQELYLMGGSLPPEKNRQPGIEDLGFRYDANDIRPYRYKDPHGLDSYYSRIQSMQLAAYERTAIAIAEAAAKEQYPDRNYHCITESLYLNTIEYYEECNCWVVWLFRSPEEVNPLLVFVDMKTGAVKAMVFLDEAQNTEYL